MPHILLIEDDEFFRGMVRSVLKESGYEVAEASDGREGLIAYACGNFDLVITDLIMPGKEGIETIITLRKINPALKIIAMSGGGRMSPEGYLHIAKQVGADRVLTKPFGTADLLATVVELTG